MRGLTNLLTILVAAIIGGVTASQVSLMSLVGDVSGQDVVRAVMLGGAVGAMLAIIASVLIVIIAGVGTVLLGKVASYTMLGCGLVILGLSGFMFAFGDQGPLACAMGLGILAGVLADYIAGRTGTVSAAGTVAPQGQNPKSSGDGSQK
ncbi:hypothetical protein AB0C87_27935 [Actinomadura sp. NPDC048021]|uniref:hypothetical protein n=1 Tax=Actinomadura sp. NPDC048021 TaxID=3155385 RepID=UPI0033E3338C